MTSDQGVPLAELVRIEGARVLATLIRSVGDFALAEDAVQDAVVIALERWPLDGVPANPGAWLTTVARNRALDRVRREADRNRRERHATELLTARRDDDGGDGSMVRDDTLRLIFTCCHPALTAETQVALALRTLCGFDTAEVARVFVASESAMGQRLSRARRKITVARIPYRVPADHELPDRLRPVLATVYAVFTLGHTATTGASNSRFDLAVEGIRLARLLVGLMPDEPECAGLLALTLATHARRDARFDSNGDIVLLADQDRRRWYAEEIAEAAALVEKSLHRRRPGPYQVQAAIAALHSLAPTAEATDWEQILALYDVLITMQPSPIVAVNRSVAVAEHVGPAAALLALDDLDAAAVAGWHHYWAARGEYLARLDRFGESAEAFERAVACGCNESERRHLTRRRRAVIAADTRAGETGETGGGVA